MMEFEPIVSPIFAWILGIGIFALLGVLIFQIHRSGFSQNRKITKQVLTSLFLLALIIFIANPVWKVDRILGRVLIVSEDLENVDFWKDSLGIQKAVSSDEFRSNSDSLILLGSHFPKEFLYSIRAKSVDWIIPNSDLELAYLNYKGILRQGETQRIQGSLALKAGSKLSIFQSEVELESVVFESDQDAFQMELSAAVVGRNEWELRLNEELLGTIRFFVQPSERLNFQLQFGFPGPEIRTLSRYLIGKGGQVQEEIQLSKNTAIGTAKQPLDSIDIFIIDPSQIQDSKIKKQLERGASLLLINVNNPEVELKALNRAFGTNFEISGKRRVEVQVLENGLEALPFEWKASANQRLMLDDAVAIQQLGNSKVGVSLLQASFPMAQSGDSVGYDKIWNQILGELQPDSKSNWKVAAPVFQNQFFSIEFNGKDSLAFLDLGSEQNAWSQSLINRNSKQVEWITSEIGWQQIGSEMALYVNEPSDFPLIFAQQERADFLQSKVWLTSISEINDVKKSIPFWAWGILLFLLLSLLWLEPKLGD